MEMVMHKFALLVLLIFIGITSAALAQDVSAVFCGDLSDSDCGLLKDSAAAMQGLNSAGFNFALDMSMNNPGASPGQPNNLSFRLEGSGAYAFDQSALPQAIFSPQAMTENLDKLPELLDQTLKAISADANLTLFFPPELVALAGTRLPDKAGLSFRMVDGVAYVNLDKLAELDTGGTMPRGWLGIDLAEYLGQMFSQQMGGLGSSFNMSPFASFNNQELASQFMTIIRAADTTIDGQSAATFVIAFDMGAMMSSPEMQAVMRDSMRQSFGVSGMSDQQIDEMLTQMMPMMANLYDGFQMNITQVIGLDDHYVHQGTATIDWPFDMGGLSGQRGQSLDLSVNFEFALNQFNTAPEVVAPADAMMIPLSGMMPGAPQM
jgi:hypothetical protein